GLRNTDGPAPGQAVVDDEAGYEILVFAGRHAVLHEAADDLVAGSDRAIPGAVLGGKDTALVLSRKLIARIERHSKRGRMRLDQNIRYRDLALEVAALALVTRVFVGTKVVPGPAVERAFAHTRDVIGHESVAKAVTLVGGAPHLVGCRIDCEADAVA